jgi:hypothetical protein
MGSEVRELVNQVLSGSTEALSRLLDVDQHELIHAAGDADLVLGSDAVAEVLRGIARRSIDGVVAQRWASFVRRGYFEGRRQSGSIKPLVIEYEPRHEEVIAEIVSRLDQIGDRVDGELPSDVEIDLFLQLLGLPELE